MERKLAVKIYWQKSCTNLLPTVCIAIRQNFPQVTPVLERELVPSLTCYDSERFQYDAVELLQTLPPTHLALYVLGDDLYHPGYRFLYGAGMAGKAVVSKHRPATLEGFCKEVCHELGHALGLEHCGQHCLMQTSVSEIQLENKGQHFCPACQKKLQQNCTA